MKKKPTIAIFTTAEGHESIAEAIAETIKPVANSRTYNEKVSLFKFYAPIYQLFPSSFTIPFNIAKNDKVQNVLNEWFRIKYEKDLLSFYEKCKPSVCISAFYFYSPVLERIMQIGDIPFINVLSDPRTIHPILISKKATINFAFDSQAVTLVKEYAPETNVIKTGWFVRKRFEEEYDQKKVRKELSLDQDVQTFLIASGSEGTTMILKIVPFFFTCPDPVQVVVACGSNDRLFQGVNALNSVLQKTNSQSKLIPLKFTKDIHKYMQAANLVVGKAGPNMLFETIATHTPFMAITHISGQEDGNLDIIREYNLGYVEENPLKASRLLREIITHPEMLQHFLPDIKKMAKYNQQAKQKLLAELKSLRIC